MPLPNFILELQLTDNNKMKDELTGKTREGEYKDAESALPMYSQDLHSIRAVYLDRWMTRSIAEAIQKDGSLIETTAIEEALAHRDRAFAHHLNGNNVASETSLHQQHLSDVMLSKLAGIYVSEDASYQVDERHDDEANSGGKSSRRQGSTTTDSRRLKRDCEAYKELKGFFDLTARPCGHEYCRACLHELLEASLTDESLFPPRCCLQPITVDSVSIFLTKDLTRRFEEKKVEFSTPNRTYCSNSCCSSFIRLSDVHGDAGT